MNRTNRSYQENNLGRVIKDTRLRKDLTQEEVAEEAGITPNYLAIIEMGTKLPSLRVLIKIAKALGVKTRDLITF